MNDKKKLTLLSSVIEGGYCIGCGACAILDNSPFSIKFDKYYQLQAVQTRDTEISEDMDNQISEVCPFSERSQNEDTISKKLFNENGIGHSGELGYFYSTYAGYVKESDYRDKGSSGGMVSWFLVELLNRKLIDGVIHVRADKGEKMFAYTISHSVEEVESGAKSKYYPVEMSHVLAQVKKMQGKYAIVGIPCFIKAVRLLTQKDSLLQSRIKYCIGLVCGHLKSANFARSFSWQCGIKPQNLQSIDFRTKLSNFGANDYGVTVTGICDEKLITKTSKPVSQLFGTNWGYGFFKYKACDFCDDVLAETADITFGDAWLPRYVNEYKGTNIIVVRNSNIDNILQNANNESRIHIEDVTEKDVIESQKGGFTHRKEDIAYRLYKLDEEGKWYPPKRIKASNTITKKRQRIQDLRTSLAENSHNAFERAIASDNFDIFISEMDALVKEYNLLYKLPLYRKALRKVKGRVKKIIKLIKR